MYPGYVESLDDEARQQSANMQNEQNDREYSKMN